MRKSEFNALHLGLYQVFWKDGGGTSLAAMGQKSNGDRWLAPTNWLAFDLNSSHDGDNRAVWTRIDRVVLLFRHPGKELQVACDTCGAGVGHKCGYMAATGDPKHPLRNVHTPQSCPGRWSMAELLLK
jgi:hypothetical protein